MSCWANQDINPSTILAKYQLAKRNQQNKENVESIELAEEGLQLAICADYLLGEFYQLLSLNYSDLGEGDLAIKNINLAIQSFKNKNQPKAQFKSLNILVRLHLNNGSLLEERKVLDEALTVAQQLNEPAKIFDTQNALGLNYYYQRDYEKAIQYFINNSKKLDKHERLGQQQLNNFRSIGIMHSVMENNDKAIAFYNKAIAVGQKHKLQSQLPTTYYNIGLIYISDGNFGEAEINLEKGLKIAMELGDRNEVAYTKLALADLFAEMGRFKKAKLYAHSSLIYFKQKNYLIDEGQTHGLLGKIYLDNNEEEKAFEYLKKAETIFVKADNKALRLQIFDQLAHAYAKVENFESAFEYQEKQIKLEKILSSNEKEQAVIALQTRYESELQSKEQELKIETLQEEKQNKSQHFLYACLIGFLLLLLSGVLWSNSREKNKRNTELLIAKIAADKAARAKSEFLATMSHEIRTPLNGVVGMVNVLHKDNPRPEQKDNLDILRFSADNLLNLVNDILDFAKFESGHIQLERNPFDIKAYSLQAFLAYESGTSEAKVQIHLDMNLDKLDRKVVGDVYRYNQVMNNLANNAMKFTEKGRVDVKINILEKTQTDVKIRFEVCDTGIGISKEKQKTIFEKYTQANSNTTRLYGGTGLGLNISKEIVELHGSELKLESELGKGSRFYFDIVYPLEELIPKAASRMEPEAPKIKDLNKMKILLAEDNKVNQLVAKRILEKWNVDLTIAEDGLVALAAYKENKFDLVLMDIQMPNMDGIECAKCIRELPNGNVPIYSMTASTLSVELKKEYARLMDGHVGKPFSPEGLYQQLSLHAPGQGAVSTS